MSSTLMPLNTTGAPASVTDNVMNAARDLPTMLKQAEVIDPATADKWTGKALVASKTPWGTLAVAIVGWASSKYALGWDSDTCAIVAGACLLIGAYLMRLVTELPITGIFTKATVAQVVAAKPAA